MMGKVAIIHDWLNGMRGGEKVLEEILELFPDSDIFTLFLEEEKISEKIKSHRIFVSNLNRHRFIRKRYRQFLPVLPSTIEEFNLKGYDLVISSSHCVAKGVIPHPDSLHISYIHSPMRYIWDQYHSYFGEIGGVKKSFIKSQISKLRTWDVSSSSRVDYFKANSNFVKKRIKKYYRRVSEVIHPPVDTDFYQPISNPTKNYFVTISALVPYKENRLLVKAFNKTKDRLIIVGKGAEEKKLKQMAEKNVEFRKNLPDDELKFLVQNAIAFVFAGIEDFGIAFVEAQACGVPIVAYKRGGVLDIVKEGTGVLFDTQKKEDLIRALDEVKRSIFRPSFIRENSLQFSREKFKKKFKRFVDEKL